MTKMDIHQPQLGEKMQRQHFIAVIAITIALVLIAALLWHVAAD
jgi:hypothetical protein